VVIGRIGEKITAEETDYSGSEKVNAIPGKVEAFINIRILPGETVQSVIETVRKTIDDPRVRVTPLESYRDPSPTTPVPSEFYRLLVDTSRSFFPEATFTPYLVMGGTDSRYYAPLTGQILRFSPILLTKEDIKGPHGINERLAIADYKKGVHFLYQFIKNADSIIF
jgi:carboxypeptidase PM20D1